MRTKALKEGGNMKSWIKLSRFFSAMIWMQHCTIFLCHLYININLLCFDWHNFFCRRTWCFGCHISLSGWPTWGGAFSIWGDVSGGFIKQIWGFASMSVISYKQALLTDIRSALLDFSHISSWAPIISSANFLRAQLHSFLVAAAKRMLIHP